MERTSNLEESIKGKDVFNSDSTNIAEIIRQRKGKKIDDKNIKNKLYSFDIEEKKERNNKLNKLSKDKKRINKNVILETQLVKLNVPHTMDNIINIKKINEIRQALRRRYGSRNNINKIFQQWARTFPNKITVYDAYKMLNSLCIPYNETKAFIASGSIFGNEFLNLEEFSNLIFTEDEKFNSGPYKISSSKNLFNAKEENENDLTNKILLKSKI